MSSIQYGPQFAAPPDSPHQMSVTVPPVFCTAVVVSVSVGVSDSVVLNSLISICPTVAEPVRNASTRIH